MDGWIAVKSSGILGLLAIVLTIIFFAAGIFVITVKKTRKAALILLICAFIPLGLGLIGTAVGHANVNRVQDEFTVTHHGPIHQMDIREGHASAWSSTYIGLACSIPLLLLGLIGLFTARTDNCSNNNNNNINEGGSHMDRKEILEKLARQEISKEEADRLLNETGPDRGPSAAPPMQGGKAKGRNWGCLIGLILILILLLVVPVLGFFWFTAGGEKSAPMEYNHIQIRKNGPIHVSPSSLHDHVIIETEKDPKPMDNKKDIQAQTDRIKKMAEEGKITSEEAERLIEALVKSAEKTEKEEKKDE